MKPESENFEALQRLLALKRYEQPPPGYFNGFADRVLRRIDSGGDLHPLRGWERLPTSLSFKPALAGAFGLAVVGIYTFGLSVSHFVDEQTNQATASVVEPWPTESVRSGVPLQVEPAQASALRTDESLMASSMQPVISAGAPRGLFAPGAGLQRASLQPASFSLRGY